MRSLAFWTLAIGLLAAASASDATAQTVLGRWNFNNLTPNAAVVGSGTLGGYGQSPPSAAQSNVITNGAASDPGAVVSGTTFNRSLTVNPPQPTVANNGAGVWFTAPTTGMSPGQVVQLSWSQSVGFRSSRYWQVLVSTTGGTTGFSIPSGGFGSSITQSITGMTSGSQALSGTATVSVSNSGLVDFRTLNNLSLNPAAITATGTPANFATGFVDNITFTLPAGQGYENNANFAFAIVGAFDPAYLGVSGSFGYVSSVSGSDSFDGSTGYNRSLASGGSMRLDLVTVSAVVPEPSTCAMLGAAAVLGGSAAWRRRRRRGAA